MSKADTYSRNALCPFFRSAYSKGIKCEGFVPGTYNRTVFYDDNRCDAYINSTCSTSDYHTCPVYLALMKKYADLEDRLKTK